jgi:predicted dehydrogenase
LKGFFKVPGVKVLAGADVYDIKRARFEKVVKEHYATKQETCDVQVYDNFSDLLNRKDIDAVVIATPDHWHALIAIEACKAGKDVYLEKPMTFTVYEGQQLIKAVRQNKRILQVGSQQRSDKLFQHAVKVIQENRLGDLERIQTYVGAPPKPYDLPAEEVPAGLNWDKWLGPLPTSIHYNNELDPPITLDPVQDEQFWGAWRWYKEMGGGFTTDWGAHMFDIIQWAMQKDGNGPVKVIPAGVDGAENLTYIYDNGVPVVEKQFAEAWNKGIVFHAKDGNWLRIERGLYLASDDSLLPPKEEEAREGAYEIGIEHHIAFIEAVRSRKDPNVPVEIGHSSCTMCNIGNIASDLNLALDWDPAAQKFVNSDLANTKLHYQYREGYSL